MARTNYLINSYGAVNAAGQWTGWLQSFATTGPQGVITKSIVAGFYGSTAQRFQYTAVGTDVSGDFFFSQSTAVGTFSPGEAAMVSIYLKGTNTGTTLTVFSCANNAADAWVGNGSITTVTLTPEWQRVTAAYATLPANTSRIGFYVKVADIANGDAIDLTIDAAQVEKGSVATGYIPTIETARTIRGVAALMMAGV